MKKLSLIPLSLLLVIPLYTHADVSSSTHATSTKEVASTTEQIKNSPDQDFTLCQQQAIEARDTEIATSRSAYNIAMANALTERKNREKAAVAVTDKDAKKNAIKTSVDTYKNLVKKAQNDLTDARKIAWQNFENTINACRDAQTTSNEETRISASPQADTFSQERSLAPEETQKKENKETPDDGPSFKNVFRALKSLFD